MVHYDRSSMSDIASGGNKVINVELDYNKAYDSIVVRPLECYIQ